MKNSVDSKKLTRFMIKIRLEILLIRMIKNKYRRNPLSSQNQIIYKFKKRKTSMVINLFKIKIWPKITILKKIMTNYKKISLVLINKN